MNIENNDNNKNYLLPVESDIVTPQINKKDKRGAAGCFGTAALGILGIITAVQMAAEIGRPFRLGVGDVTIIDLYISPFINAQSIDILEGYCPSPLSMKPEDQKPKEFYFKFKTNGILPTEVNIIEKCP